MLALVAGAGDALLIARQVVVVAEGETPVHPYLARQMSDFGFRQTLEVRTLGYRRRSSPYRSTTQNLAANLSYMMNNTRDTRFILVRATIVV